MDGMDFLRSQYDKLIVDPETGQTIELRSALARDKSHPAYQAALSFLQANWPTTEHMAQSDAPVSQEQLDTIRGLLGGESPDIDQAIALIQEIDKPELWDFLCEGLSVDEDGKIEIEEGCEVHDQVEQDHRKQVAFRLLSAAARLNTIEKLDLSECKSLENLAGIEKLTNLQSLNLGSCSSLTSLAGIENLTNLQSLSLGGSKSLTSLAGIENLSNLQKLTLDERWRFEVELPEHLTEDDVRWEEEWEEEEDDEDYDDWDDDDE